MKKQNHATFSWPSIDRRVPTAWLVGVFVCATFFAWWFYASYTGSLATALGFYFKHDASLVVGSAASTLDDGETGLLPRRLNGVLVAREKSNFLPYAVMIENLFSVRPQSGLSQAAVVYEALAEGGATRFMAVFDPSEVIPEIMPVRSARPYYLEWVSEYGALYAYAGGSPKALTVIWENSDINALNALSRDAVYFWRDTTKSAPHNLVTSSEKMNFALRDKGLLEKKAEFRFWLYKDDALLGERGVDGQAATFNFSYGRTYKVDFRYNRERNVYYRFNADEPHLDKNTGQQIEAKNVIVQLVREPELNGGQGRLDIYVGGEGKAWIFRDGQVIEGTWKKSSRTDRTLFYDGRGQEVALNRGNTWVHVVPETQAIMYQ